jgi:hypothetical protein
MKLADAKSLALNLIFHDIERENVNIVVEPRSPDPTDPGKFLISGKPARVIAPFNGWFLNVNLSWLKGGYDQPIINEGPFYWYVFAIPNFKRLRQPHYLICDYLQVRDWVLSFQGPRGRDHRDHHDWRADIQVDCGIGGEKQAYFQWGDEPPGQWILPDRIVRLDNISVAASSAKIEQLGLHVGTTDSHGESEAHRRLKIYIAQNPTLLSLHPTAQAEIEHLFITGDKVDVLFRNSEPLRTVAEIELSGTENIIVGIHQAIKYRSLAAAESSIRLEDPRELAAHVISFSPGELPAYDLARAYNVNLLTVDPIKVLAPTK